MQRPGHRRRVTKRRAAGALREARRAGILEGSVGSASYRRFLVNSQGEFDTGLFLQLELKGLSRFGSGFDELLPGDDRPLGDD